MTLNEIHKELYADLRTLENKIDNCHKDFRRKVLKASKYPLSHLYDCRTKIKKNLFMVNLYASKRGDFDKPLIKICGIYNRSEGNYAAALALELNMTTIYPPHFFSRYRERIIKVTKYSNEEIIKQYFSRNGWGFVAEPSDAKYKGVYNIFEPKFKDSNLSFVCVNSEGFCFGENQGNINVIKTIISEDMLFPDQQSVFTKLKDDFELSNKRMYGNRYPF